MPQPSRFCWPRLIRSQELVSRVTIFSLGNESLEMRLRTHLLHLVRGNWTKALSKILSRPFLVLSFPSRSPPHAGSRKKFQEHAGVFCRAGLKKEGMAGA